MGNEAVGGGLQGAKKGRFLTREGLAKCCKRCEGDCKCFFGVVNDQSLSSIQWGRGSEEALV